MMSLRRLPALYLVGVEVLIAAAAVTHVWQLAVAAAFALGGFIFYHARNPS